ncbi:MAG: AIR synthase family protein [Bacillota bacterium]|nr:AIR synthase family protein [Bacillota bacterium]
MILDTGKLDSELLKKIIFGKIKYKNDDVKVRPGIGEDCAVMDFGDFDCVMSTDPISSAVNDIGRLAIHITCNDIASNGVQPLGIMLAVMLPEGTTDADVEHIMTQAAETAAEVKVEIIGGHTEITPAVKQPVIVSTAIGKITAGGSQSGNDMQPGDYIIMTKTAGLEGCGIAATDHEEELRTAKAPDGTPLFDDDEIRKAQGFLDQVSVVREGVAAGNIGTHGMHDITEGGILGAVWEMCQISGTGCEVWEDAVPAEPEARKICDYFGVNILRLISSGSMVIIAPADVKNEMIKAINDAGVNAAVIGVIKEADQGIRMITKTKTCGAEGEGRISVAVDPPYADEIYKIVKR